MIRRLIEKPIAVTMSLIAIMVLGIVAANMLPVSLMPDIKIPEITVQISGNGMSAREIDQAILKPLRNQLMQLSNLRDIRTEAKDDAATIFLQFEHGTDIDFLFIEANEKIDRAMSSLPRDVERPRVIKASATDIPAFYINMTLKEDESYVSNSELFPVSAKFMELSNFAGQIVVKRIEQISQVAMVDMSGLAYPELLIVLDNLKLSALGLTPQDIENTINRNNIKLGNLTIRDGEYRHNIRFESTLSTKSDIENIYINVAGRIYRIKDFAKVIEHPQKVSGLVRSDGKSAVSLAVIKQSEAKMKELKTSINNTLDALRKEYPHINFTLTRDQTKLLEYSIDNLRSNIIVGALLAILIIFVFMQDFRSPTLISITIPVSLVVSLLFFYLIGLTINIISLSGLVLGIGMMVDNSIIVIDNISQHWDRGRTLKDAVVRGTNEVFTPMLSSVLTTCSVFIPLIFLSGIAGALFYDQAMAVTIGLFSSLMVSVLVIPVYYYLFYRKKERRASNKFMTRIPTLDYHKLYEKCLKWFFRHRMLLWIVFLALTPVTLFVYSRIHKEKLPPLTKDDIVLIIDWNDMISAGENDIRVAKLLSGLDTSLVVQRTAMIGIQQFILPHTKDISPSESVIYLKAVSAARFPEIEAYISGYFQKNHPEALYVFENSGNIFDMIFSDNEPPLVAKLKPMSGKAPDPDQLNGLLAEISRKLPGVQIEPVVWQEHILLTVKTEIMALYGISYSSVFSSLKNSMNQNTLFQINNGTFSIPVVTGDNKIIVKNLLENSVRSSMGIDVPLSSLIVETRSRDLKNIVSGAEGDYFPLNIKASAKEIPTIIDKIKRCTAADKNFTVDFAGTFFSNSDMIKELIVVLIVALFLLYFILAAQFESVVQPVIILTEVIIDIFGAMVVLWIFGISLNIMSLIGLVVMCGIVINDSILKVDTINKLRKEGYSLLRAIISAGSSRLKPILMTSLTTILALAPFLYRGDMGSDLQYPMSVALIAGMIIGTLVSIFFIPMAYYEIYKKRK